ncbi:hypothetical protein [Leptobacterium flavescens]|uniref:hypothetical protein n=1 Tax=Leptobacterium flavescens TaxID=472055 RepID=UPI001EF96BCD|nr:hypothetical protein [Leptobacterium flavescens]
MKYILLILIIIILTIFTQIGGIVYLISILIIKRKKAKYKLKRIGLFLILYTITTFLIVPNLAPLFGRKRIAESDKIAANNMFTILMNRNYVKPEMNVTLAKIAKGLDKKHKGIKLVYLDAGFPFINGFPLFPHLSHNDGKKIDISFIYQTKKGDLTNKKTSISGYGVYTGPKEGEYDQITECERKGNWQYSFTRYLSFGRINKEVSFSERGTRDLILEITRQPKVKKLFLEPHLKSRLNLKDLKIRYHGCQAVRHDDHIHLELK